MFFQKKKQERLTEYICPCLTLSNVKSLVVLPGVRYDITFDKQMSDNIIEYFKQHRDLNFDTIKKIELEMHLNEGAPINFFHMHIIQFIPFIKHYYIRPPNLSIRII